MFAVRWLAVLTLMAGAFSAAPAAFGYWNTAAKGWRVAKGCYRLMLGASSRHVASTTKVGWGAECGSGSVRVR